MHISRAVHVADSLFVYHRDTKIKHKGHEVHQVFSLDTLVPFVSFVVKENRSHECLKTS